MPPTGRGYTNTSGVSRRTADGVFYVNGRYLCQRLENGTPCNREISSTRHSISSHNNHFHADSPYRRQMTRGKFPCRKDGCNHQSPTFAAILAHARRQHGLKGSANQLKILYGIPISRRRIREAVMGSGEARRESPPRTEEKGREEGPQGECHQGEGHQGENRPEENPQERHQEADNDGGAGGERRTAVPLDLIDPRLINWDKNADSGSDSDGSSLDG
ncbi:hypothetical protein ANO14919_071690 [Xylariales sp. No.14919]|nr:hypothetical protein ANO14919_071690 [Xylariales sp. No.14919]